MPCMRMSDPKSKRTEGPYARQRDFTFGPQGNESISKGMVNQSR